MADRLVLATMGALAIWASASIHAQGDRTAQVEQGRQVVAQVCTTCHTTLGRMLQVHKQTPEQWRGLVYFMISRGAQVMPPEIDPVIAYLATTSADAARGRADGARGGGGGEQGGGARGRGGRGVQEGPVAPKDVVAPVLPGVGDR